MIEVYYCMPSDFSGRGYATGSQRFADHTEFIEWLEKATSKGPVMITYIIYMR